MNILIVVLGVYATAATTLPYETTSGNLLRQLLESQICDAMPNLPSCAALNQTLEEGDDSHPGIDVFENNHFMTLVLDYIASTQRENTELKARENENVAHIARLEQTNEQLESKVRSLEVDWLPTVDRHGGTRRGSESGVSQGLNTSHQEAGTPDTAYQPTASLLRPVDCSDYLLVGAHKSGIYNIYPFKCRCSEPVKVWCDMETDGGGWTVILNRRNGPNLVNFTRSWMEYQKGFGDASTEYWIGTENLHVMTNTRLYTLRLDFEEKAGNFRWSEWPKFMVANEDSKYKLDVPTHDSRSMTDNCMAQHHGKYFSTYDYDNDGTSSRNCAKDSGWWYHNCASLSPTIPFDSEGNLNSACTYRVNGKSVQLQGPSMQLKIRPRMCSQMVKAVHFNSHTCNEHNGF